MIINGIELPAMFDFSESKPWDLVHFIDTKVVWKFGSYDNNVSLDLLCATLGVESPKTDMSGDKVKDVFWIEKDLKKIAEYCEGDVYALASCYLKMKNIQTKLTK
jgi:predicted PolB exonuclease-like 3'-5' exonuclease